MFKILPVASDDAGSHYYAKYRTIKFWHTVRDAEGMAIMFTSRTEAENAAKQEWWRHVHGDQVSNRKRKDRESAHTQKVSP